MKKMGGYEALAMYDEMFLIDSDENTQNVIGCFLMEKFEFESMKAFMLK